MRWQIVIPQKPLAQAKSRLLRSGPIFAEAMLRDVLAACADPDFSVAVLGNDPWLATLGVGRLPDAGGGLSGAVRVAVEALAGPVAVVMGDLPCLTAAELRRVLRTAEGEAFGVVADAAGTGTTLLTARRGIDLHPAYGAGSFARHTALGAVDLLLDRGPAPGLRRDVDTLADLLAAAELGLGRATAVALAASGLHAVHPGGP